MLNDNRVRQEWKKCQLQYGELYYMMIQQGSITLRDKTLRFKYFLLGDRPRDGYALIFGLHGGGGCETSVNDQQFSNHLTLYKDKLPKGVIWFVPRSCEQASDMWWKDYIPQFFQIVIKGFVLKEIVNPNKVFVTGYSAGGDGIYHLGPMMADDLAGAAMMAGHPNGVQLYNVRNIAFSVQVGGQDEAYNRNNLARQYIGTMQGLGQQYGGFSTRYCNVFQSDSHWMKLKDANIFGSFLQQVRNPYPSFVIFKQHPRTRKQYFYYIEVDPERHKELLIVEQRNNSFYIQSQLMPVSIFVNRLSVDYGREVQIWHNGVLTATRKPEQNYKVIKQSISARKDPFYIFQDCFVSIPINDRVPFNSNRQRQEIPRRYNVDIRNDERNIRQESLQNCCSVM